MENKITSTEILADEVSKIKPLSKEERKRLIENSEIIKNQLAEKNEGPETTFAYIIKYAEFLMRYKGEGYVCRIGSRNFNGFTLWSIEPPCGSTTYILDKGNSPVMVDAGYPCFRDELLKVIHSIIPAFDSRKKDLILTHMDMDHCGLLSVFDNIFMSESTYRNFVLKFEGKDDFREGNPFRAPFYKISSVLSDDYPPSLSNMRAVSTIKPDLTKPLSYIGNIDSGGFSFEIYETSGGHVDGSIVILEKAHKIIFTGDTLINPFDVTDGQKEFNTLAPYILRSVNQDSEKARLERKAVTEMISGENWTICGGHGAIFTN